MTNKSSTNYLLLRTEINSGVPINNIKDTNEQFYKPLLCQICLCLNNDSFTCGKCDKNICKKCVKIKISKDESINYLVCPKCESNLKEISKFKKNMMDSINIKCINQNCNVKIMYQNLNSHLQQCPCSKFKCLSEGCDYIDYLDKIEEHSKNCKCKVKFCSFCEITLENEDPQEHERNCKNRLIYCKICDVKVPKMYYLEHNNENCFNQKLRNSYMDEISRIEEKIENKEQKINSLLKLKKLFHGTQKRKEKKKKEKYDFQTEFPVINIKSGKYSLLNV